MTRFDQEQDYAHRELWTFFPHMAALPTEVMDLPYAWMYCPSFREHVWELTFFAILKLPSDFDREEHLGDLIGDTAVACNMHSGPRPTVQQIQYALVTAFHKDIDYLMRQKNNKWFADALDDVFDEFLPQPHICDTDYWCPCDDGPKCPKNYMSLCSKCTK